jgi:hypothetical protein
MMNVNELTRSMCKRTPTRVVGMRNGQKIIADGIVNGMRAEDGSGKCWLVTMMNGNGEIFVRAGILPK